MKGMYTYLYVDYKQSIWKFFMNKEEKLCYSIMYDEGKWTKEKLIDNDVTGFSIFVNDDGEIHLVYGNIKGELKYCILKDKQWFGKSLYNVEYKNYNIENIKVKILGATMHIFFVLSSKSGSDHGMLMHCIWDGNEIEINKVKDIILNFELNDYYLINTNNKREIYLFYLSDDGDEISFNYIVYKGNSWGSSNRLYGILGKEVYFDVELTNNIHILNKSKEKSNYSLDHVVIDLLGEYKSFNVYTSTDNLKEPLIFNLENKIYASWIKNNFIYYSSFNGVRWEIPKTLIDEESSIGEKIKEVERYNVYISDIKRTTVKEFKLYGDIGIDLELYYFNDFINKYNKDLVANSDEINIDENLINYELDALINENKVLEDKLAHLNLLFKKSQRIIEEHRQEINILIEQKRKAEENNGIFVDLQKDIQIKNEKLNNELNLLKEEKLNIESKMEEYLKTIEVINQKINELENQLVIKNNELKENRNIIIDLENKNKVLESEGSFIKEEKEKLVAELEVERNQTIMEKLLRRKS